MSKSLPDPGGWFADLMKSQEMSFWPPTENHDDPAAEAPWTAAISAFAAWQRSTRHTFAAPWVSIWPGLETALSPATDKRFADPAWTRDPRFEAMAGAYLAQTDVLRRALDAAPLDARSKAQWGFLLRQVTDALSPANSLATNPEALQRAVETGGASLAEGLRLFTEDLAKGRISMTDDSAFEVGRNVCLTKGSVVFQNQLIELIQYTPTTPEVHQRPLLIVPPCINKYYILDLQPANSFVAYAVAQGHTVFLVSWRNADPEIDKMTWDDYLDKGVFTAIDTALQISQADRLNTLGFCVGGTLLASALAVLAARGRHPAAGVTLLTTMLDFADTGEIGLLVSEQGVAAREKSIGKGGLLKGSELSQVFAALRANDLIWPYVVNSYLKGQAPPAFDLLYWNSDDTNLPGPMFCWYLRNTYLENKLAQPGATIQCGEPVDLSRIGAPAFIYASKEDHIVPWKAAYASTQLLSGDITFVLGASGHIAGVINPPAKKKRSYWTTGAPGSDHNGLDTSGSGGDPDSGDPDSGDPDSGDPAVALDADPDAWFARAESTPGSWWPRWSRWLGERAGPMVGAPTVLGSAEHPAREDAPGSYVRMKAQ